MSGCLNHWASTVTNAACWCDRPFTVTKFDFMELHSQSLVSSCCKYFIFCILFVTPVTSNLMPVHGIFVTNARFLLTHIILQKKLNLFHDSALIFSLLLSVDALSFYGYAFDEISTYKCIICKYLKAVRVTHKRVECGFAMAGWKRTRRDCRDPIVHDSEYEIGTVHNVLLINPIVWTLLCTLYPFTAHLTIHEKR